VARRRGALVELHRMLREGEVEKVYLAVAKGAWEGGPRELRQSLHKYVDAKGERRVAVREDGMKAVTQVRVLKKSPEFSLLEVRLLTGRTHQIRVHLAHAGHPVLGDAKYGDFELNRRLEKQGVRRLFLHASRLGFVHPVTREKLALQAPLPAEIKQFVDTHLA
jgi:23S rRNA pseudouridine955/2504/2580 synthase